MLVLLAVLSVSCKTMQMGPKASIELREYSEVIDVPGKSMAELYVIANSWFVDNFNSAESVIQFQDKEEGRLMGKYTAPAKMSLYNYSIKSTIQIDIKDQKLGSYLKTRIIELFQTM